MSDQAQTRPLRVAKLVWKEGHNAYKEFTMYEGSPTLIGRDKSNHIVLADPMVSKHHAEIDWQDDAFVINDLGSSNGTLVNRTIIFEPTKLEDKSHIEIGIFSLIFQRMEDEAIDLSADLPISRLNQVTQLLLGDDAQLTEQPHDTLRREDYSKQNTIEKQTTGLLSKLANDGGMAVLEEPDWVLGEDQGDIEPTEETFQDFDLGIETPIFEAETPAEYEPAMDFLEDEAEELDISEEAPNPLDIFQVESPPAPGYTYEATEEIQAVEAADLPARELDVPMEYAYNELLMSIETIYDKGQALRDKWLLVLNGIDDTMSQIQKLQLEMSDLENQARAAELEELFEKISQDPDNVKLLIELSDRSDLLARIFRSYFDQGNKIRKITEDLEAALLN